MEDEFWFKPLTNLVYKSKNGRILADNNERYGYYSKAVLRSPSSFWAPDIFICNGWQSALVPGLFKKHFDGTNQFYKNIKTVLIIHELNDYVNISRKDLNDMEVPIHESLKGESLNIYDVASFSADHIIIVDKKEHEISKKLIKSSGISANKEKLSVIKYKYSDDDLPDFIDVADQLDKIIKKYQADFSY